MKKVFFSITAALLCVALGFYACKKDKDPELSVAGSLGTFVAAGETKTFDVTSNVEWSISGQPAWLTVTPPSGKGNVKVSVKADPNTEASPRNATLTIAAKGAKSVPVPVSQAAAEAAATTYTISASTLSSFGSLQTPYTQPAAQTVTVTRTGTGDVTLAQPSFANYTIGTLSRTTLTAANPAATFTVRPNAGLAVGTYNGNITVSGSDGASATVAVSFSVSATPTFSISASPNNPSFGSLQTPYTQPAAQTVTITNTGNSAITLTAIGAVANYTIGALSTTSLPANGSTATFTVRPNAGLAAGTYNPTITINGNGGATTTVNPTFTVTAAPNPNPTLPEDFGTGDL